MLKTAFLCIVAMAVLWPFAAGATAGDQPDAAGALRRALAGLPKGVHTPNRYALVIGVDDYESDRINDLAACANDARELHKVLVDPAIGMFEPKNTTLLLNRQVTKENVIDALDRLGRRAGPNDLVLVFFSGHGCTDEQGRAFWVMSDTEPGRLRATALPESDVSELLGQISSKRLVVLIDACYSAATAEPGRTKAMIDLDKIYPKFEGAGRVVISASRGDQVSLVISDRSHAGYGHSVFAWHVIKGLSGAADVEGLVQADQDHARLPDGIVTVSELWDYIKDRAETTSRQLGGAQQPQLKGQIGSRFLLCVNGEYLQQNEQQRRGRLEKLKQLFMDNQITSMHYEEALTLLAAGADRLDKDTRLRRQVYLDMLDGTLPPKYLDAVLEKPETAHLDTTGQTREAWARQMRSVSRESAETQPPNLPADDVQSQIAQSWARQVRSHAGGNPPETQAPASPAAPAPALTVQERVRDVWRRAIQNQ